MKLIFIGGLAAPPDLNGLKPFGEQLHKNYPKIEPHYFSYKDDVTSFILNTYDGSPIVLVGHSLGGDKVVKIGKDLSGDIVINCAFLLDPVPKDNAQPFNRTDFVLPDSIDKTYCFLRKRWFWSFPYSFPIRKSNIPYLNTYGNWSHTSMCTDFEVQEYIKDECIKLIT